MTFNVVNYGPNKIKFRFGFGIGPVITRPQAIRLIEKGGEFGKFKKTGFDYLIVPHKGISASKSQLQLGHANVKEATSEILLFGDLKKDTRQKSFNVSCGSSGIRFRIGDPVDGKVITQAQAVHIIEKDGEFGSFKKSNFDYLIVPRPSVEASKSKLKKLASYSFAPPFKNTGVSNVFTSQALKFAKSTTRKKKNQSINSPSKK
jgi:hypothetical protein